MKHYARYKLGAGRGNALFVPIRCELGVQTSWHVQL